MAVFAFGYERIIEQGVMSDREWEGVKRDVVLELVNTAKRKAPLADEDPHVSWNFNRNWRTARLPATVKWGSELDYFSYVVQDATRLWDAFAGRVKRDYIAERIAGMAKGASIPFYLEGYEIFQNGKKVSPGARLTGPQVDFAPTADFSLFLEQWNYSRSKAKPLELVWGIGMLHAIARQLAVDYAGIHTVFAMPVKPKDRSTVREINNRATTTGPIQLLPIIRILPRHYARGRKKR